MKKLLIQPKLNVRLFKLKQQQTELLNQKVDKEQTPISPIGEIKNTSFAIRTSFGNLRFLFLLPWLVGISLTLYWHVDDFYKTWKATEKSTIELIDSKKSIYGENYFEKTSNEVALRIYQRIVNGKMPFKTYVHYHYYETAAAERLRRADTVLAVIYSIVIPALFISILSYHRRAPLIFDREHRIVYTWRKGRVWAQYYDELVYYTSHISLDFLLYTFTTKNEFKYKTFVVTPSGNPFYNSPTQYRQIMTYVTRYMENGREDVANREWSGRRGWYLFNDKKPDDFEEQLQTILEYIRTESINERAELQAKEWEV